MTVPTIVAVAPFVLKNVTLTVDTDDFKAHVSQVSFDPSGSQQTWKGLSPEAVFTDQSAPTWGLTLAYAQDWATPNSLSRYLYDHEGEVKPVTFVPDIAGQGTWSADVVITAGAVGGTVDAFATSTVTLGVQGRPTFTAPVLADPARVDSPADVVDEKL
jgi:hypothetical protein